MEKHGDAAPNPIALTNELESWFNLYSEEFGITFDRSKVSLPPYQADTWMVVSDDRITEEQIHEVCSRKYFICVTSIIRLQHISDCQPFQGTVIRRFRADVEACGNGAQSPWENLKVPANEVLALAPVSMTLKERMLLELWYFRMTGKHLDHSNWTLCSGSQYEDGKTVLVPRVGWDERSMSLNIFGGDLPHRGGHTQPRLAIP